jgi:hypothetical protein
MTALPTLSLDQIKPTRYEDAFLIGDLLTERATLLAGEPKAGKSLLACGMVIALLDHSADEFLGFPIHRHVQRVLWGVTDDGADEELQARLVGAVPGGSVKVLPIPATPDTATWTSVVETIRNERADLFVLDHVLGSLPDGADISSPLTATQVAANLRVLSTAGVPVLGITHTPKGPGEGFSTSSSIIGGRAIAAAARGLLVLRLSKKGGRRLDTAMNRGKKDHSIPVLVRPMQEGSEVPVWSRREESGEGDKRRARAAESGKQLTEMAEWLVATQPPETSMNALANARYHEQFGLKPNSVRRRLKDFAQRSDETGRWEAVAPESTPA